jgi:hypothetical protein
MAGTSFLFCHRQDRRWPRGGKGDVEGRLAPYAAPFALLSTPTARPRVAKHSLTAPREWIVHFSLQGTPYRRSGNPFGPLPEPKRPPLNLLQASKLLLEFMYGIVIERNHEP